MSRRFIAGFLVTTAFAATIGVTGAQAATSVKLIPDLSLGLKVNGTTGEDVCVLATKDKCQKGTEGTQPGAFASPTGIAVGPSGDVYVTDAVNNRVQELEADGKFVLMFGKGVNETTKGGICTEEEITHSGVKCKAGEIGGEAGAFVQPSGVAINPSTGDVYIAEAGTPKLSGVSENDRVDQFTATGQFVSMWGHEVNASTKGNMCTAVEVHDGASCQGATPVARGTAHEPGVFALQAPVAMAFAPGQQLLYVGDEHRVQEFEANGTFKQEINLTDLGEEPSAFVTALAVDTDGDAYLTYSSSPSTVRVFNPAGKETTSFEVMSRHGGNVLVRSIALDSTGHLAVAGFETEAGPSAGAFGELVDVEPGEFGELVTEFASREIHVVTFNSENELWASSRGEEEVSLYKPVPVAKVTNGLSTCVPGNANETNATYECTLTAEVNLEGVGNTEAWFEVGSTPKLGEESIHFRVDESGQIKATIVGLRPDAAVYERAAATDENLSAAESVFSKTLELKTPIAPPVIIGEPGVSFVKAASAVLSGELNPENAPTSYEFQYAPDCPSEIPLERCPAKGETQAQESSHYGPTEVVQEAQGLQPGVFYRYRLLADDEQKVANVVEGGAAAGVEGSFTTTPVEPEAEAQGAGGSSEPPPWSRVLPAALVSPGAPVLLAVPPTAFPAEAPPVKPVVKALTDAQKLAKALAACRKKAKQQRAGCEKQARKRYPAKQANNKTKNKTKKG